MYLLFALACAPATAIPGGTLSVSLAGSWEDQLGVLPMPRRGVSDRIVATHRLILPDDWAPDTRVVLHANGMGWRTEVSVDGVRVAEGVSGLRPLEVDLTGRLHSGVQSIGLALTGATETNILPGKTVPALAGWTYDQPRRGTVAAIGEIWLEIAAARRFDDVSVTFTDGTLHARAALSGAEGATVRFTVVRDGETLATFPAATVEHGVATADVTWDGPLWTLGGSEKPFLQYLVATLPSGESRQVRFGARELKQVDHRFLLNGEDTYLAVERFMSDGDDPRVELAGVGRLYALAGLNGMELHATMHADGLFDAADELGLLMVDTPVCDGRRRLDGVAPVTDEWAAFETATNAAVAAAHRQHPSLVLWNIEAPAEAGHPELYAPFAASGVPTVDLRESLGYNDDSFARLQPDTNLPLYVNELAFHVPVFNGATILERLNLLLQIHKDHGFGITVPNELTSRDAVRQHSPTTEAYAAAERQVMESAGVHPFVTGVRRGPAEVRVSASWDGRAVPGEVVVLRAPGQAPVAAATDIYGKASLTLDYAGPAEVGSWRHGKWTSVTLTPGHYEADKWVPSIATVELSLN